MDLVSLLYGRQERSWQAQANCMGVDPDLFFPERGASTREAKEVCRGCVVREDCLEYALANGEKFGIWGGMSERERRRLRRPRAMQRRAARGQRQLTAHVPSAPADAAFFQPRLDRCFGPQAEFGPPRQRAPPPARLPALARPVRSRSTDAQRPPSSRAIWSCTSAGPMVSGSTRLHETWGCPARSSRAPAPPVPRTAAATERARVDVAPGHPQVVGHQEMSGPDGTGAGAAGEAVPARCRVRASRRRTGGPRGGCAGRTAAADRRGSRGAPARPRPNGRTGHGRPLPALGLWW